LTLTLACRTLIPLQQEVQQLREKKMTTAKIQAEVANLLAQGADPMKFRNGIAGRTGSTVEEVTAVIAAAGAPAAIDAEVVAQNRLAQERKLTSQDPAGARSFNHEEE
jgi:hypothetical protein